MSTSSIRPEELHEIYRKQNTSDVDVLFCDQNLWSQRSCPLCEKKNPNSTVKYAPCSECGLIFLQKCPPTEKLKEYFSDSLSASFFHSQILLATEKIRRDFFDERMSLVQEFHSQKGRLLDLGCSIGTFLEVSKERGWSCAGVEPNQKAIEIAQGRGHVIYREIVDVEGMFDIVTAWEVIAHLEDPLTTLKSAIQKLRSGGYLILTTPNVDALEYRLLGHHHPNRSFPFLQLFSSSTISLLLQKLSLQIERLVTPGKMDVMAIRDYYAPQDRTQWPTALEELLFGNKLSDQRLREELQQALVRADQSGHLLVVARKI